MKKQMLPLLTGEILEESDSLTLAELCRLCRVSAEDIYILIEEGIIEPTGEEITVWRFHGACVRRVRRAMQLRADLGVNWAGAALALELLDEINELRTRLRRFEEQL
jgi:chaperone modulatory protein CbpM